ncbi:MAG: GNAT family N-acetyltransferase, partial [Pseudomonadota bacterium]
PHQRTDGPVMACMVGALAALGLDHSIHRKTQRAALTPKEDPQSFVTTALGKKRLRELNRQWRRLEDKGPVSFTMTSDQEHLLNAFEQFLTLELRSWKGRRGTALYNHRKVTAFSRQIVAELAAKGDSEIAILAHNGKPIAALILLSRDGWFVPWKIAFDETYRAFSPGMQIMVKATSELVQNRDLVMADSLAVEDHWMMNHIWPDRLQMQGVMVGLTPQARSAVEATIRAAQRRDGLKSSLKALLPIKRFMKR